MKSNNFRTMFCLILVACILTVLSIFAIKLYDRQGDAHTTVGQAPQAHLLQLPIPPAMLTDDSTRQAYVVMRYWDKFDFADTTWAQDTTALEETFATYAWMLNVLPQPQAEKEIKAFFGRTEQSPVLRDRLYEIAEKYLDEPNSPYRNEELFIPVLEAQLASPGVDSLMKIRPRYQLEAALKNCVGTRAADFAYTTPSGATQRLSGIRSQYTLLYFYNPDCHDCERVREYILLAPVLTECLGAKSLTVLAIYTDEDLDLWRSHLSELPQAWTVGRNGSLRNDRAYELRAIPCLYLLDREKNVVLKDTRIENIEAYLASQVQDV